MFMILIRSSTASERAPFQLVTPNQPIPEKDKAIEIAKSYAARNIGFDYFVASIDEQVFAKVKVEVRSAKL